MTDLAALKSAFDSVAIANRFAALSDDQWSILVDGESAQGIEYLQRMVAAARGGNPTAVDLLKTWHKAARVADQLQVHGFGAVTKRQARKLLEAYDTERVVGALQGVIEGSAGMRGQLQGWLQAVRAELGDVAPNTPPADPAPSATPPRSSTSASRFSAVPLPPGVQTGAVTTNAARDTSLARAPERTTAPVTRIQSAPRPQVSDSSCAQRPERDERPTHAAPPVSGASARQATTGAENRQYDQHVCYGRDVALAFECLPNMERTANTVMLKIARAKHEGRSCREGVNWNEAILINLEPHEVQTVAAVFLGMHDRVRYAGHGRDNQKWFEVQESTGEWAGSIRVTVGHAEEKRTVSIGATDVGEVAALFLRALSSQLKVAPALFGAILKRAVEFYRHNEARQQLRRGGQGGGQGRAAAQGGRAHARG